MSANQSTLHIPAAFLHRAHCNLYIVLVFTQNDFRPLSIDSIHVDQPCEEEAFTLRASMDEMTEAFGLSPEDVQSARTSFSRY